MGKDKSRGRRSKQLEEKQENKQIQEQQQEIQQVEQQILTPFFGLVDSNELDYFKTAESTLNINAFDSDDERQAFINSVIEESKGKELKLVTNQICSKLVERIILSSTDSQLKNLFKTFNGQFAPLSHHKYASHCIETLLVRAAALVEKELLNPHDSNQEDDEEEEEYVSMENMFLFMVGELKPYLKEMIQHQYASHVLRLIVLILSGRELPNALDSNSVLRSKKSKIARKMIEIKDTPRSNMKFQIPTSFLEELKSILELLLINQNTKSLRELCINAISSPTYSLIISVEGLVLKERPFWDLVFSPQSQLDEKDPKEEAFVEYCLSDPIGSHFLETVLKQARLKSLERIYTNYIRDRVVKIANRDKTGAYIIQVLMTRLKGDQLLPMLDELVSHMDQLLLNQDLIKQILDTSLQKNKYNQFAITTLILRSFPHDASLLESVLKLSSSTLGNTKDDWPTSEERRDLLFLEKLFDYDTVFIDRAVQDFLNLEDGGKTLVDMCKHGVFSHIVEHILMNFTKIDTITRRKFVNLFFLADENKKDKEQPTIVELLCHSNGSHIVDKLWGFTTKLNNYKERISELLISHSDKVKGSTYGKMVWKNWNIDLYMRKKFDWKRLVKEQELEFFPMVEIKKGKDDENNKNRNNGKRPKGGVVDQNSHKKIRT